MQPDAPRLSPGQLTVVVLAHAGLLGGLLNAQPRLAEPLVQPRPLMVSLIAPEIEAPQPQPHPELRPRPPEAVDAAAWQARIGTAAQQTPQPAQIMADAARAGLGKLGFVTDPRAAH